jgi:hypothetical protein
VPSQEHLDILKLGVEVWNQWRSEHYKKIPALRGANLQGADLSEANLYRANLNRANLEGANLSQADLSTAKLREAKLSGANLSGANLNKADLSHADLSEANLWKADLFDADLNEVNLRDADLSEAYLRDTNLSRADLSEASLHEAVLVGTNLTGATLINCDIYGIAAWNVKLKGARQKDLAITPTANITVDNLMIAQFIHLLLNNAEIREVIDTIGQKGVLILGRFTSERKVVLDVLQKKLRSLNFLPIVFDFKRPTAHDFTETIMTLAGLSCFIIADITNPKSSPLELQATVPNYMTPFVPIIQEGEQPFAMFTDLQNKYRDWVLDTLLYDTPSNLANVLERAIVKPALARQAELLLIKAQGLRTRHIKDYS